jgi:hypothetical protein
MRNLLSILLLCLLLASCGEEKTVEGGKTVEGEKTIQERAEQGNADAQYNLGVMYDNGQGVPQDKAEAVKWYRKAAEQGHARSQFSLGLMYAVGEGVPMDKVKAYMFSSLACSNPRNSQFDGKKHPDYFANLQRSKEGMTKEQIAEGIKLTWEWLELHPLKSSP